MGTVGCDDSAVNRQPGSISYRSHASLASFDISVLDFCLPVE
jgi:hypothetical protein